MASYWPDLGNEIDRSEKWLMAQKTVQKVEEAMHPDAPTTPPMFVKCIFVMWLGWFFCFLNHSNWLFCQRHSIGACILILPLGRITPTLYKHGKQKKTSEIFHQVIALLFLTFRSVTLSTLAQKDFEETPSLHLCFWKDTLCMSTVLTLTFRAQCHGPGVNLSQNCNEPLKPIFRKTGL